MKRTIGTFAIIVFVTVVGANADEKRALDFSKQHGGMPGHWSSKGKFITDEKLKESHNPPWVIWNVTLHDEKNRFHVISGEVRQFNIGTPLDGVAIFVGSGDERPALVAMSNAYGKFSFRVNLAKATDDWMKFPNEGPRYLYFGGTISTAEVKLKGRKVRFPALAEEPLIGSAGTRRFNIDGLFDD